MGRRVWYRNWQTRLTFDRSILARTAYVHFNPIKHGLVKQAEDYPFCSASRLSKHETERFRQVKFDQLKIEDDF